MAQKMKVTYLDGREEVVAVTGRTKLDAEKHFKRDGGIQQRNSLEAAYYMAWLALRKAEKEPEDFNAFVDLIDDAEFLEEEDTDPTEPEPQLDESSS